MSTSPVGSIVYKQCEVVVQFSEAESGHVAQVGLKLEVTLVWSHGRLNDRSGPLLQA